MVRAVRARPVMLTAVSPIRKSKLLPESTAGADRAGPTLAGVADGYALSVRRAARALEAAGVEPIEALGRAFDPDVMEAVGMAAGPAGTVVAEGRRGYRWRGVLLRPAQVTVGR